MGENPKESEKMKTLFFIVLTVICFSSAQDKTQGTFMTSYYRDTLTVTKDTIDYTFDDALHTDKFSVVAFSSSTDSINVYTQSLDASGYQQVAMTLLTDNTTKTFISATTTRQEWLLLDPKPKKIRLIKASAGDASTVTVIVQTKRSSAIEGR